VSEAAQVRQVARLLAQLAWADRRILAAFETDERLAADADALRTLAHIVGCEQLWLARMRAERSPVAVWPSLPLEECAAIFRASHDELARIGASLTPDALAREVAYMNSAGEPWRNTVGDILVHVAMHGQYHRGQVVRAIRRAGGVPPATDYIVWARTEGPRS
jgi:uncharacterized damage-inducible protein DinB